MGDLALGELPTWYLEQAANDTFLGLQTFVRDTDLTPEEESWYEVGRILRVRGNLVATPRVGGLETTHRFAVLSNHMYDISDVHEAGPACRAHAARSGSRFKVLAVMREAGGTQVVLLHLPDDERWALWRDCSWSVEGEILETVRDNFESKLGAPAIPELRSQAWRASCAEGPGFAGDGTPLPLDEGIAARLRPAGETDFRLLAGRTVFIRGAAALARVPGSGEFPDCIALGAIDRMRGLRFALLCSARLGEGGEVERRYDDGGTLVTLEMGTVAELPCAPVVDACLWELREVADAVHAGCAETDRAMARLRSIRALDDFRSRDYPDDVSALLYAGWMGGRGLDPERVWLRLERADESGGVYASLLNEPFQDLNAHVGDVLPLALAEVDGRDVCLALLPDEGRQPCV